MELCVEEVNGDLCRRPCGHKGLHRNSKGETRKASANYCTLNGPCQRDEGHDGDHRPTRSGDPVRCVEDVAYLQCLGEHFHTGTPHRNENGDTRSTTSHECAKAMDDGDACVRDTGHEGECRPSGWLQNPPVKVLPEAPKAPTMEEAADALYRFVCNLNFQDKSVADQRELLAIVRKYSVLFPKGDA